MMAERERRITSLPFEITPQIRNGTHLAGDDYRPEQLAEWFAQEQEAFYEVDAGNGEVDPWYAYMRYVNEILGLRVAERSGQPLRSILVLGPGPGFEVKRFAADHPDCRVNFLEASKNFRDQLLERFPTANVMSADPTGAIHLPDGSQDVICAFGVLHHIPNVSRVLRECARVASPGGFVLIREPCSSMGDWRYARSATPNERGISRRWILASAASAGLVPYRPPLPIMWEPMNRLLKKTVGFRPFPFAFLYAVDRSLSRLIAWNDRYWRDSFFKKIGPSSYFYVFRRPERRLVDAGAGGP